MWKNSKIYNSINLIFKNQYKLSRLIYYIRHNMVNIRSFITFLLEFIYDMFINIICE
jgi:hypothetical protein